MPENPTPTPGEFQRDVGTGEQLGYGEATQLNDQLAQGDAVEEQIAAQAVLPEPTPQGLTPDPPIDYGDDEPEFVPGDGAFDDVLFGDAQKPTSKKKPGRNPVPNSVVKLLPMMAAIVNDPTTPIAIKAAYELTIQRLEEELRAKGQ